MVRTTAGLGLLLVFSTVSAVFAAPGYNIATLGLYGPEHTRDDGYQYSYPFELNEAGQAIGYSDLYNGGSSQLGISAWLYDGMATIDVGLVDSIHTRDDGYRYSYAAELNEAGQVVGFSDRYLGSSPWGHTAWLYDGTTTIDIGLAGAGYTRNDGYRDSYPNQLNDAGQATGQSERYFLSTSLGQSAWFYDGTTTIDVGLVDSTHTRDDGYKFSDIRQLNEAGQVAGYSDRYSGSTDLGYSVWLYNGTTTIDIGLVGSEHTRSDGYKRSYPDQLNEAGQATGYSFRYSGSGSLGRSTWLYNGTTTVDVGLVDAAHTRNDGYRRSDPGRLNEAGQAAGSSRRYSGSSESGGSVWFYDGSSTIDIGLVGSEHTRNDGYKLSQFHLLSEGGQVVGRSNRFNSGSTDLGDSAWLYNGTTTIDIGLGGSEHTRNNGYKDSWPLGLNDAGQAIGRSYRYNSGSTQLGQSAWLYNGTTTVNIGLVGPEYTGDDGHKYSDPEQINEAGQVLGWSYRYDGLNIWGQDAWLYDPVLDHTFPFQLSTTSDGYMVSKPDYLGDDGLVLGHYALYDELDDYLGTRAFYFTIADGLHDLGSLVDGGLSVHGWDLLASTIRANGLDHILGVGDLTSPSDGQATYLLTPVFPGDYNGDGVVDAGDYTVWRDAKENGDALLLNRDPSRENGTDPVDEDDYAFWRAHFGLTLDSGAGAGSANGSPSQTAVPEPGTIVLGALAGAGLLLALRRRAVNLISA